MGEEYHVRGAPRIPPLVVVVSITSVSTLTQHFNVVGLGPFETKLNVLAAQIHMIWRL